MNVVLLQGVLSSEPRRRELPSGSLLLSWEVTTQAAQGKQSVPVVWFDPPASVEKLADGEEVVVLGTVRRRFFAAHGRTVSSTEVLAERAAPTRRRAAVSKLVLVAAERLEGAGGNPS